VPGPYTALRLLGKGGMGAVWEARHDATGQHCALKVVLHAGPADLTRFAREARALAGLRHPNVVRLHAAELSGSQPYLVQELLTGGTLAELLEKGPLDPERARTVALQVTAGVAAAHAAGVLHRDLKPDNVLFDEHGVAKVADFGLALSRESRERLTLTGEVLGTPDYMAPEQAIDAARADERADVYGLGGILYTLLTGGPPLNLRGRSLIASLAAIQSELPVPVERVNPAVPRELAEVCRLALAKDPNDRYPTARAFGAALRGELAPPRGTKPAWLVAGALTCVLLAGVVLAVTLERGGSPHPRPESPAPVPSSAPPASRVPPRDFVLPQTLGRDEPVVGAFVDGELIVATSRHLQAWDGRAQDPQRQVALREGYFQPYLVVDLGQGRALLGGIGRQPLAVWSATGLRNYALQNVRDVARQGPFLAYGTGDGVVGVLRVSAEGLEEPGATLNLNSLHAEGELVYHVRSVVWLSPTRLVAVDRAHTQPEGGELSELEKTRLEAQSSLHLLGWDPSAGELEHLDSLEITGGESMTLREREPRIVVGTSTGAVLRVRVDLTTGTLSEDRRDRVFFGVVVPVSLRGLLRVEGDLCLAALQVHHNVRDHGQYNGVGVFEGDRPPRVLRVDGISPRSLALDRETRQVVLFGHGGKARVFDLDWILEAAVEPK